MEIKDRMMEQIKSSEMIEYVTIYSKKGICLYNGQPSNKILIKAYKKTNKRLIAVLNMRSGGTMIFNQVEICQARGITVDALCMNLINQNK